jgi:hypothetical protein
MNTASTIVKAKEKVGSIISSKTSDVLSNETLRLRRMLQRIFRDKKGKMTYKELGVLWGYDERMAYNVIAGERQLSGAHVALLARELSNRGDYRLLEFMLSSDKHVADGEKCSTDGDILDEINLIVQDLGQCSKAFDLEDRATFETQMKELKRNIARLEAEGKLKLKE